MLAIVDFPAIVKQAQEIFGDLFTNEPARRHVAEYLTGLMAAERKTMTGINRAFAVTTDQSCLNRWLTETNWEVSALNEWKTKLCCFLKSVTAPGRFAR
jgi:hypothetical protein